jgi:ubiquinone/menaquinone biosynthesis C-methylase UbiE
MSSSSTFVAADGDGYELNMGRWSQKLVRPFLDFVGTGELERVLDVGCGTGHLAAGLADASASSTVEGIDISPIYVAYAQAKYPHPRLQFRVGDACALAYEDQTFDRVLSLLALHFMPCAPEAIAEMRRVARPGAVVGTAVWDARGGFVANRLFFDTAAALDTRASERRAKNYTRPLTRPGELVNAWQQAGFLDVSETSLHIRMTYTSFADYWAPFLGKDGPGAAYVSTLGDDERTRLEQAIRAAYLDGDPDGSRSYAALAWAVKGIVP